MKDFDYKYRNDLEKINKKYKKYQLTKGTQIIQQSQFLSHSYMSLLRPLVTPHPTPSGPVPMGSVSSPKLLTVGLPHPAAPQEGVN